MRIFRWLSLLGLLLTAGRMSVAQEAPVLSLPLAQIPDRLLLTRGTIVEFTGTLPPLEVPQTFSLRVGSQTRASGRFEKRWTLRWDTARERHDSCYLSLWNLRPVGGWTLLTRFQVQLTPQPAFRIAAPQDDAALYGSVSLALVSSEGRKPQKVVWMLDETPLTVTTKSAEQAVWETGQTPPGAYRLTAQVTTEAGEVCRLEPVRVRVLPAIRVAALPFGDRFDPAAINGAIPLRVRFAPGVAPACVTVRLDNQVIGERREPPFDTIPWNPEKLPYGAHHLQAELRDRDGKTWLSPPYTLFAQPARRAEPIRAPTVVDGGRPTATIIELEEAKPRRLLAFSATALPARLAVTMGTRIALTAGLESRPEPGFRVTLDGQRFEPASDRGEPLILDTAQWTPGAHRLEISAGAGLWRSCQLLVCAGLPVRLRVPQTPEETLRPATLALETEPGFLVEAVTFLCDGRPLPNDPEAPLTAFWDARRAAPGTYRFQALARGPEGIFYRTPEVVVTIPPRVTTRTPGAVVLTETEKTLTLKAELLPELTPARVEYLLDGRVVATRAEAPFQEARIAAGELETGAHTLTVRAIGRDGVRYVGKAILFQVTNRPRELALRAREALAGGDRETGTEPAEAGREANQKVPGSARGRGAIGRVIALAILEAGQITVDGRAIPATRAGVPVTIEASLTPGSGKINLQAFSDADARLALERAVAYCKRKVAELGYEQDWSKLDITIRFDNGRIQMGGGSAGAAIAVALLSAALQLPVDPTVAITGALGEADRVEPVGGIDLKAASVFLSASLRTLVLPAGRASRVELDRLYARRPELFATHRVFFARDMEQALRRALVGYLERYVTAAE